MDSRWRTGDDRQVVGIGEARHDAIRKIREPIAHEATEVGENTVLETLFVIGCVAAIHANHYDRFPWPSVVDTVNCQFHGDRFIHDFFRSPV